MPVDPIVTTALDSPIVLPALSSSRYPAQASPTAGSIATFTDPNGVGSKVITINPGGAAIINITLGLNGVTAEDPATSLTASGVGFKIGAISNTPITIVTTRNYDRITSVKVCPLNATLNTNVSFIDPISESNDQWKQQWPDN